MRHSISQGEVTLFSILDNIADITVQDITKSRQNIRINSLDSPAAPFFHYFESGIRQLRQPVPGNAAFIDQFFQPYGYVAVGADIHNTSQFFHFNHQYYFTE